MIFKINIGGYIYGCMRNVIIFVLFKYEDYVKLKWN